MAHWGRVWLAAPRGLRAWSRHHGLSIIYLLCLVAGTSAQSGELAVEQPSDAATSKIPMEHAAKQRSDKSVVKVETDRAIEDYNRAIALKPDAASTYVSRGNALNDIGEYPRLRPAMKTGPCWLLLWPRPAPRRMR